MLARFAFKVAMFCTLASCAANTSHASNDANDAPIAFIGPPGNAPPVASNPVVSAYGAFTFASPENYCHMVRWIISGAVLPEYADEPKPVPYRRGTKVRVIRNVSTDCTTPSGESLSVANANLKEVTVLPNQQFAGEERYVLPSDLHSPEEYAAYSMRLRRAGAKAHLPRSATIAFSFDASPSSSHCEIATAQDQVNASLRFFRARNYPEAQRLAGSAAMYVGACHEADHSSRISGDAYLLMGKSMLARANSDGTKYAFAASLDFMKCGNPQEYPEDYQYCRGRYGEADKLAHPSGT